MANATKEYEDAKLALKTAQDAKIKADEEAARKEAEAKRLAEEAAKKEAEEKRLAE